MESYYGYIRTPADAILLIQACYDGALPRIKKRLSPREGRAIQNGSIFIWEEHETGLKRWTDGRKWSPSRVAGRFLIYREMQPTAKCASMAQPEPESDIRSETPRQRRDFRSVVGIDDDRSIEGPKFKLMKLSFSVASPTGHHWHVISYYHQSDSPGNDLREPTADPSLKHIHPQKELFPPSLVNDRHNFPIFSRGLKLANTHPVDTDQICKMCGGCYRQKIQS